MRLLLVYRSAPTILRVALVLRHWSWVLGCLAAAYIVILLIIFAVLKVAPKTPHAAVMHELGDEWERKGLLQSTKYRIDRAYRSDGRSGEEPFYYLHLADGSGTLCLSGSYLRDYEFSDRSLRNFPCTELTVRKEARSGITVDLLCGGSVIEPERGPGCADEFHGQELPGDGEILREPDYDELIRRERARTVAV